MYSHQPDEGLSQLVKLHDDPDADKLAPKLRLDVPFVPHVMVGYSTDAQLCRQVAQAINGRNVVLRGVIDTLQLLQDRGAGLEAVHTVILC